MACRPVRRGFTLIELLVVVAIIALLIAILLPSLGRARHQALASACMANQRSIAQAAYSYATENENYVPVDGFSGTARAFYAPLLGPLMGAPMYDYEELQYIDYCQDYLRPLKTFKCPALKRNSDVWIIHYEVNGLDFPRYYNTGGQYEPVPGFTKLTNVRRPAETVYAVEANGNNPPPSLGVVQVYRDSHLPYDKNGNIQANPRMIHAKDDRHLGRTSAAFFDGHAEMLDLKPSVWTIKILAGEVYVKQ